MARDFEEELERYRRAHRERGEDLGRAWMKSPAVIVTTRDGRRELLILSGEPKTSGATLRVSTFLPDGPWGHHEYDSQTKAIEDVSTTPFISVKPASDAEVMAWTSTPEFRRGAAAAAMIQAENELRYRSRGHYGELEETFANARKLADAGTEEAFQAAADYLEGALREYPRQNPCCDDFAPNPAWVTRSIADAFDTINERVPPKWHPKLTHAKQTRGSFVAKLKEYGCGAYGCVLPTLDDRTVLKVTTDVTEAQFAADVASTLIVPIVVDYRMVLQLAARHRRRPVFLLWRESAEDVGKMEDNALITAQHRLAQVAYEEMYRTGTTSRGAIGAWRQAIRDMQKDPDLVYLSRGMLRVFDEQGVFFGDVHGGNVGRCVRGEKLEWVIVDPGHVSVVQR